MNGNTAADEHATMVVDNTNELNNDALMIVDRFSLSFLTLSASVF